MALTFTRHHQEGALARYVHEHCSPLIITISTAQVESTCLRNGLLFHELLAAFSQLDNINTQVRMGTHNVPLPDTHIRFERSSEVRPRYGSGEGEGDMLEQHLRGVFQTADIGGLPPSLADVARGLAEGGTTGWSQKVEDGFISSMAHSEACMTSQPSGLLAVVSTADVDPVACMQELLSAHHAPPCMSSGQYDASTTSVPRGYCLLHDGSKSSESSIEVQFMLQQLRTALPQGTVHLLVINSLPTLNIAQPDIWSRWLRPRWFSKDVPAISEAEPLPLNPNSGKAALGCRLSMEDCMALRNLCISLFQSLALPALERRAWGLGRTVAENRRGVKNFFKGFLRKPRDETPAPNGGPRYPLDRLEAQTLLLADTCFAIGDFESAGVHYRSVRDDFRADRSNAHFLHCTLMVALCQCHVAPNNLHDRRECLESISQLMYAVHTQPGTPPQLAAYYALLGSELYVAPKRANLRSPNEAAHLLLQAAQLYAYTPPNNGRNTYVQTAAGGSLLVSALLTERAALLLLQAGKVRHFALYSMVAGTKYQMLPLPWKSQASLCFSSALLLYENGNWGGIKSKLTTHLLEDVSNVQSRGPEVAKRAFLLMIRGLEHCLSGRGSATSTYAYEDAISLLTALSSPGPWGQVRITDQRSDADTAIGSINSAGAATSGSPYGSPLRSGRGEGSSSFGSGGSATGTASGLPRWASSTTRDTLAAPLPECAQFADPAAAAAAAAASGGMFSAEECTGASTGVSMVEGLSLPEIDRRALTFMVPVNGLNAARPLHVQPGKELEYMHKRSNVHKRLKSDFLTEMQWEGLRSGHNSGNSTSHPSPIASPPGSDGGGGGGRMFDGSLSNPNLAPTQDSISGGTTASAATLVPLGLLMAQTEAESQRVARKVASKPGAAGGTSGSQARVPLGEPVVVRLTLKNKLPNAIQLTNIRLECLEEDRDFFTADQASCEVAARGTVSVLVRAVPARLGTFRLPAVTWRIGSALEVRQRLLLPGSLLHDTLGQRAQCARAPPVSLNFEVIQPHPLLELHWEGRLKATPSSSGSGLLSDASPPECYEGELLWAVLVMQNIGGETACKIQLKLDRPFAVWYTRTEAPDLAAPSSTYDESRLSTFGQSGTLTVLPDTLTVPAGQTVRLGAFIRFPKSGNRTLHVLASYSGLRPDGEVVAFGPGTRCRTSYWPRSVIVLPSAAMTVTAVEQSAFTKIASHGAQKTLVIYLQNNTHGAPPAAASASSAGGGTLQVDTVVSMGSVEPAGRPSGQSMYQARANEGMTLCLPVAVLNPQKSSVCTMFSSSTGNSNSSTQSASEEMTILCRLLGLQRSWLALAEATAAARSAVEADELALQTKGPKSIQSVRREAKAKAQSEGGGGGEDAGAGAETGAEGAGLNSSGYEDADGMGDGGRDSVFDDLRDVDRSSLIFKRRNSLGTSGAFSPTSASGAGTEADGAGPGKQVLALLSATGCGSGGRERSASAEFNSRVRSDSIACDDALSFTGYADTAAVIARAEARQQTTALAVFWTVAAGTASPRRVSGVHWVLSVPVLGTASAISAPASTTAAFDGTPSGSSSSGGASIADSLLVSLQHPPRARLSQGSDVLGGRYRHRSVCVSVKLKLRSVYTTRMYVSVIALPFGRSLQQQPGAGGAARSADMEAHFDKLLRWQGKCSYLDVLLEPGQEEGLPFSVVINEEGLFDLNSFDVRVRSSALTSSSSATADSSAIAPAVAGTSSTRGPSFVGQAPAVLGAVVHTKAMRHQSLVEVAGAEMAGPTP